LINAAGFDRYRILPEGEWPDTIGALGAALMAREKRLP